MSISDRLFWYFAMAFFATITCVAVSQSEAAIAGFCGYLFGTTAEQYRRLPR